MSAHFTQKENERLQIINQSLEGIITNEKAAVMLGISIHQVKRLKKKVRIEGSIAVVHKLKGRQSNHHIEEEIKERALTVIKEQYADFKPTFTSEKLAEYHGITLSYQTVRRWMTKEKLWKPRKQKQNDYHSWRPRKEYFGELEQFDGSYHYWFENRFIDEQGNPIEVCLLAAIDDATGKITKAVFSANEGITAVFTFWKEYIEEMGKPRAIYLDKFSTYKINHKAAVDNKDLLTQFQRAMRQLAINPIPANSAQAKGRIERRPSQEGARSQSCQTEEKARAQVQPGVGMVGKLGVVGDHNGRSRVERARSGLFVSSAASRLSCFSSGSSSACVCTTWCSKTGNE